MRSLLKLKYIIAILFTILLCLSIYIYKIELHWVEWKELDMPIKNLPSKLEGKKLVQISDIHVGGFVDKKFLIHNFEKAQQLQPDIVVYTGDFVSMVQDSIPLNEFESILAYMPKGSIGTVAILGNHDYRQKIVPDADADSITFLLRKTGITVLRNDCVDIYGLHIIGIDDFWSSNFFPQYGMNQYDKNKATIVLTHNPDACDVDIWNKYEGWILSGHTHGGQIRIPFWGAPLLPVINKRYDEGLKQIQGNKHLYINRGLGHSIPVRFNARPEITVFSLKKAQ